MIGGIALMPKKLNPGEPGSSDRAFQAYEQNAAPGLRALFENNRDVDIKSVLAYCWDEAQRVDQLVRDEHGSETGSVSRLNEQAKADPNFQADLNQRVTSVEKAKVQARRKVLGFLVTGGGLLAASSLASGYIEYEKINAEVSEAMNKRRENIQVAIDSFKTNTGAIIDWSKNEFRDTAVQGGRRVLDDLNRSLEDIFNGNLEQAGKDAVSAGAEIGSTVGDLVGITWDATKKLSHEIFILFGTLARELEGIAGDIGRIFSRDNLARHRDQFLKNLFLAIPILIWREIQKSLTP